MKRATRQRWKILQRSAMRLANGDIVIRITTDKTQKRTALLRLSREDVEFLWHKSNPPMRCFWEDDGMCALTGKPCNADPKTLCNGFVSAEDKKQEEKT